MAGTGAFGNVQDFSDFRQSLYRHCYQSARIVHDFCGEWYSKTQWERGSTCENTAGFVAVALEKLRAELSGSGRDGMSRPRLFLCSGVTTPGQGPASRRAVRSSSSSTHGPDANVNLRL